MPPTRLAFGALPPELVPDASGLFNLMRNLGEAIGLAMIDTVIYSCSPAQAANLLARLQSGNADAARFLGLPATMIQTLPLAR